MQCLFEHLILSRIQGFIQCKNALVKRLPDDYAVYAVVFQFFHRINIIQRRHATRRSDFQAARFGDLTRRLEVDT